MTKMEIIEKIKELVEIDNDKDSFRKKCNLSEDDSFYPAYHGYVSFYLEFLLKKAQED